VKPAYTVASATRAMALRPDFYLVARWNWKSALLGSIIRSTLFFRATLSAGHSAALSASATEFALAIALAGFTGAVAQAYRGARPQWLGSLMATALPPAIWHAAELAAHLLNGTPGIRRSVSLSVGYSVLASVVTLFLMRRGIWLAGDERTSLCADIQGILAMLHWRAR
jgi:hypothetical protein